MTASVVSNAWVMYGKGATQQVTLCLLAVDTRSFPSGPLPHAMVCLFALVTCAGPALPDWQPANFVHPVRTGPGSGYSDTTRCGP